jgi:hypothetical protein
MKEIQQLRQQILSIAMQQSPALGVAMMGKLKPPSDTQVSFLFQDSVALHKLNIASRD